jgi:hypothetical protein
MKRVILALLFLLCLSTSALAVDITIPSTTVTNWTRTTSAPHLYVFYDTGFTASDGVVVPAGDPQNKFSFKRITTTLLSNTVTIPSFTIKSTRDGLDIRTSRVTFAWFTSGGSFLAYFDPYTDLQVPEAITSSSGCTPSGTCATFSELHNWNRPSPPLPPDGYYTKTQIDAFLANINVSSGNLTGTGITVTGGTGAVLGSGTSLSISNTAVTPGTYNFATITVGADGRITSASSGTAGTGDVSSNTGSSIDSEVALFSGVGGKTIKRASGTGIARLTSGVLSVGNVNLATEVTGTLADGSLSANVTLLGSSIDLSGAEVTGTLADARFPATLPAASGINLTALNATNLGSGTVPAARFPAFTGDVTTVAGGVVTTLATTIPNPHTWTGVNTYGTGTYTGTGLPTGFNTPTHLSIVSGTSASPNSSANPVISISDIFSSTPAVGAGRVTIHSTIGSGASGELEALTVTLRQQAAVNSSNIVSGYLRVVGDLQGTGNSYFGIASSAQRWIRSDHTSYEADIDNQHNRTVTNATNATPIVITTSAAHHLSTGDIVTISSVGGNTAANGTWTVTVTGGSTFSLDTSVGNGAYTSGGTMAAHSARDYATAGMRTQGQIIAGIGTAPHTAGLVIDTQNGTTSSFFTGLDIRPNSISPLTGYAINIPNATSMYSWNAAGSAKLQLIGMNGSNQVAIGSLGNDTVFGGAIASVFSNNDTNTIGLQATLAHVSANTVLAGFGNAILSQLEAGSGTLQNASRVSTFWTDPTDGSPDSAYKIELAVNNTLTEVFRLDYNAGNTFNGVGSTIFNRIIGTTGIQAAAQYGTSGFSSVPGDGATTLFYVPDNGGIKGFTGRIASVVESSSGGAVAPGGIETFSAAMVVFVRANADDIFATTEAARFNSFSSLLMGTTTNDASAIANFTSTTRGVLFPRMTTGERDAISSPTNGLVIYNSTTSKLQVRAGGAWVDLH